MLIRTIVLSSLAVLVLSACASQPAAKDAQRCAAQIDILERELPVARAKRARGHAGLDEAAGLLVEARQQQKLGNYLACVEQLRQARIFTRRVLYDE